MNVLYIISVLLLAAPAKQVELSAKVVNVIDGNTLEVFTEEDETVKILLSDVDCPENGQMFFDEATSFTKKIALKKKVTVMMKGKDRWGNKLAVIIFKNGESLNHKLVEEGLGWAYKSEDSKLNGLENKARKNKIGLWSQEETEAPWIYRRKQTMLQAKGR